MIQLMSWPPVQPRVEVLAGARGQLLEQEPVGGADEQFRVLARAGRSRALEQPAEREQVGLGPTLRDLPQRGAPRGLQEQGEGGDERAPVGLGAVVALADGADDGVQRIGV
jgi:hypothetical protein